MWMGSVTGAGMVESKVTQSIFTEARADEFPSIHPTISGSSVDTGNWS